MQERTRVVTFKGKPLTLIGPELKIGDKAPEFSLLASDLTTVKLSDSKRKIRFLSVVPSLDTSVCSMQTRRLNEELSKLESPAVTYTISCDLPFAQARFAAAEGISNFTMLSDHREVAFGKAYGVLIKELRLLARSIFIVDGNDRLTYIQRVAETTDEPDYDDAIRALRAVAQLNEKAGV